MLGFSNLENRKKLLDAHIIENNGKEKKNAERCMLVREQW
jgi:hypothetical protein